MARDIAGLEFEMEKLTDDGYAFVVTATIWRVFFRKQLVASGDDTRRSGRALKPSKVARLERDNAEAAVLAARRHWLLTGRYLPIADDVTEVAEPTTPPAATL